MCSEDPAWKRLIRHTLSPHERIPLIMAIFSDHSQVDMVRNLFGDDAQSFVNMIDEVSTCTFSPLRDRLGDSRKFFHALPVRRWISLNHKPAIDACTFYMIFVATVPCFRSH